MQGNPRRQWKLDVVAILAVTVLMCAPRPTLYGRGRRIIVGAAISLKESFNELGGVYERRTGTKVILSFAASGELEKQIEAGAPVDVFASASEREMDELQAKNLIDRATRADFVRNSLVLIVPRGSKVPVESLPDLQKPSVTKIAIGNPKTVPAGQYAQQLLRNTLLWPKVESRLILAENVRQVLDYVARGEVEAGIVYATDAQAVPGKVAVVARATGSDYGPILYPLAVVQSSSSAATAKGFIDLVLSPEGAQILKKYGFLPVK